MHSASVKTNDIPHLINVDCCKTTCCGIFHRISSLVGDCYRSLQFSKVPGDDSEIQFQCQRTKSSAKCFALLYFCTIGRLLRTSVLHFCLLHLLENDKEDLLQQTCKTCTVQMGSFFLLSRSWQNEFGSTCSAYLALHLFLSFC